jgi:hypothetical protein
MLLNQKERVKTCLVTRFPIARNSFSHNAALSLLSAELQLTAGIVSVFKQAVNGHVGS